MINAFPIPMLLPRISEMLVWMPTPSSLKDPKPRLSRSAKAQPVSQSGVLSLPMGPVTTVTKSRLYKTTTQINGTCSYARSMRSRNRQRVMI